jgi:hypothetical protein
VLRPAAHAASELFFNEILQRSVFKSEVSEHALELAVIRLYLAQPLDVGRFHAAVLGFPFVIGGGANAMLSAKVLHLHTCVGLLKDANDLLFAEA